MPSSGEVFCTRLTTNKPQLVAPWYLLLQGLQSFFSFPQKNPLEFTRDPFLDIEILKTLTNFFGDLVAVDERKK